MGPSRSTAPTFSRPVHTIYNTLKCSVFEKENVSCLLFGLPVAEVEQGEVLIVTKKKLRCFLKTTGSLRGLEPELFH